MIGVSLSKPHSSETALQDVCVCLYVGLLSLVLRLLTCRYKARFFTNVCTYGHIPKILIELNISYLHMC